MSRIKPGYLVVLLLSLLGAGLVVRNWYLAPTDTSTQLITTKATTQEPPEARANNRANTLTQISPEGSMLLQVERTPTSYDVLVGETDPDTEPEKATISNPEHVFTGALKPGQTVTIPFNTWAPNNAYFFLKLSGAGPDQFLVFKTSGEPFGEEPFLNITTLYTNREIPYKLQDVTGWAANGLLLVQTDTRSYWFEVPSQRFIILSTQF